MSTYTITRLIRAVLRLGDACEVDGIRLEPIVPFISDQALVSETIRATSYREASNLFDRHLLPAVDAMTVVTGAALVPLGGSTLIEKSRSKYVYLHAVQRGPSPHLTLDPRVHEDVISRSTAAARHLAAHAAERHAAYFLRQAALAENLLTSAFHTLQAAEALSERAGRRTDYVRLRGVMGDVLYRFFYETDPTLGDNRRNALAHGRLIPEEELTKVTTELQERLLDRVRMDVGGNGEPSFTPVQGFVSVETNVLFLERVSELPSVPDLVNAASTHQFHSASDPRWVGVAVSRRLHRQW